MTETLIDTAHRAMEANPDDIQARMKYFERLADSELFLLLTKEAEGETLSPETFDISDGTFILAFDTEDRLSAFVGKAAPYAALSGRVIAGMLQGQGIGIALNPEVAPRIDAGLRFLVDRNLGPVAIVAHSQGATRGSNYLRDARPGGSVAAFVAIGVQGTPGDDYADIADSLVRIHLPVLDIYGENDLEPVLARVDRRFAAGSRNRGYSQQMVPGANHFFDGHEAELVTRVYDWLEANVPR